MLKDKKIGIVGAGNMGEALISGLLHSRSSTPENIICSDIRKDKLKTVKEAYGVLTSGNNLNVVSASEIVVYAVKPQIMASVLRETAASLDMSKLIISIAAGVPLSAIESCLNKDLRLVRVMPNISASVKEGAAAIAPGKHALKDDLKVAKAIFDSVGKSVIIEEELMDAITGLSGSGPAYLFLIVDALADAGVKMGLSREDALLLSTQTVLGAAKLLMETNEHPGKLKDRVTSPGGTAIAGLHTLEQGGLRTTLINAVEAATRRSKELGEMMIKNFAEE
ncbi:MAG: pyrroline-5-carboxylate reductase [Deltaproteobacteria bacterium]|nr:pyrroline-5-carboxylate reductase [Deltaproteobacteria bacterium]MBW2340208.1 pyrroline-5-carboxylate reductase [Deltaproteobacteria bacterium]